MEYNKLYNYNSHINCRKACPNLLLLVCQCIARDVRYVDMSNDVACRFLILQVSIKYLFCKTKGETMSWKDDNPQAKTTYIIYWFPPGQLVDTALALYIQ